MSPGCQGGIHGLGQGGDHAHERLEKGLGRMRANVWHFHVLAEESDAGAGVVALRILSRGRGGRGHLARGDAVAVAAGSRVNLPPFELQIME